MSKNPVLIAFVVWTLLLSSLAQVQTVQPTSQVPVTAGAPTGPMLEDGTPIKLRIGRTVSSADAHVGDTVDFEVLEEVHVGDLLVIPKGGTAWATVTEAQSKRRMARGGKLDMNTDSVRLVDGEKIALRAVKEVKGGGHTGAMTGAMVGTAIVFFPAAPLFLFMHGKDITIPKGTEITAYINGNFPINLAKFQGPAGVAPATTVAATGATTELDLSSTPAGAEIGIDRNFVGNTPSSLSVVAGDHTISIKLAGYQLWERTIHTSGGKVNLTATLAKTDASETHATDSAQPNSVADVAGAAKAKHAATQTAGPQN